MFSTRAIKIWQLVHTWTSLVCTAFILLLALTGLPLIFHDEIDTWLGDTLVARQHPGGMADANLDDIVATAQRTLPQLVVRYLIWDNDEPGLVKANMATSINAPRGSAQFVYVDRKSGEVIGVRGGRKGVIAFLLQLHTDMFLGLGGSLFLGLMGLLLTASIVSGIYLYAPFMRKLSFGSLRSDSSRRVYWLDQHNLIGALTIVWLLVVGLTGVINTLDMLVFRYWRSDQLAAMTAPYKDKPLPAHVGSVNAAVEVARKAKPETEASFVAFPGTFFSSNHHYAIFVRGVTPLTDRLLTPILVDAETLQLTDLRSPPWYVAALQMSRPLHFGDYGGLPLKMIWALLDVATIILLTSGLYLWIGKWKTKRSQ